MASFRKSYFTLMVICYACFLLHCVCVDVNKLFLLFFFVILFNSCSFSIEHCIEVFRQFLVETMFPLIFRENWAFKLYTSLCTIKTFQKIIKIPWKLSYKHCKQCSFKLDYNAPNYEAFWSPRRSGGWFHLSSTT